MLGDKTLSSWTNASDANWRVKDGVITDDEAEAGRLVHHHTYENYELKVEFMAAKGCNSEIFLNTTTKPADAGNDCYE